MLTIESVVPYLLDHGLIDPTWIIDGELRIGSVSRRNRNYKVEGPGGKGFLVKQPDHPRVGSSETLRRELTFRRFVRDNSQAASVSGLIPPLIEDDWEEGMSVYELISDVDSISSLLTAPICESALADAMQMFGRALGSVHRVFRLTEWEVDSYPMSLSLKPPWPLGLLRPEPWLLERSSAANHQMLRILQETEGLDDRFRTLSSQWQADTLVHGDIRFDNVLLRRNCANDRAGPSDVWLVDWEMVQAGDPAWDLAGALQDFMVLWVSSIPLSETCSLDQSVRNARIRLGDVQAAIRTLWTGYLGSAGLKSPEASTFLLRAVAYSVARLFQSVYELSQSENTLSGQAILLLQLGVNLLADPACGQVQLYGVPNTLRL
jgi:Phosphotransferase enzyme family